MVQLGGLNGVLFHADAVCIAASQIVLSIAETLVGGFAVPFGGLDGVFRHAPPFLVAFSQGILGREIALVGGFAVPLDGLGFVFLHAPAEVIAVTQLILGLGIVLISGFAVPLDALGFVFLHATAAVIAPAQPIPGFGAVLLGEFLEPAGGFRRVLLHATALRIAQGHGCQALRIALVGGFAVPLDGLGFIFLHALAIGIAVTQLTLGRGIAHLGGLFQVFHALGLVGLLSIALKQLLRGFRLLGGFRWLRRPAVPLRGLYIVFFHAPALGIAVAQLGLGRSIAHLGGFFQILHPLGLVGLLLIARKQLVRHLRFQLLQPVPGRGIPLFGGFAEAIQGFPGVCVHPCAVLEAQTQLILRPGIALAGGLAEPLGGLGFVFFCAPAPGAGDSQPILGRRVAAVRQAAEAVLCGGRVLGRVIPVGDQVCQGRTLLCLPPAAQGAGGGGGCHREGGGVAFVVAGPVVPAVGADGGIVLLVTYRAFPHEGPPLLFAGGFIPPPGGLVGVLGHAPAVGIAVRQG